MPQVAFGAVGATVDGSAVLTVTSDAASDTIAVTCSTGNVKINSLDPNSGFVSCASITAIVVNAGDGDDVVDLSAVGRGSYTALTSVSVDGGGGNNKITGSPFNDTLKGGSENDIIYGGLGDDSIDSGDGNDVVNGNEGNDTLYFGPSTSPHHLDGGSGNDVIVVTGSPGNDTVNVFYDGVVPPTGGAIEYTIVLNGQAARSAGVETFQFSLGDGDDAVTTTLLATTALVFHGGGGSNVITLDPQCSAYTLGAGTFSEDGLQSATFDGFATPQIKDGFNFDPSELNLGDSATTVSVQLGDGGVVQLERE